MNIAANEAVFGPNTGGVRFDRTALPYAEERFQYRDYNGPDPQPFTPTNARNVWGMQPGNKIMQSRIWPSVEDHTASTDANTLVAMVQIVVRRALIDANEFNLYDEEMLTNMTLLLEHDRWSSLAAFDSFLVGEEPSIPDTPEQDGLIISYQLNMQCRVTPD